MGGCASSWPKNFEMRDVGLGGERSATRDGGIIFSWKRQRDLTHVLHRPVEVTAKSGHSARGILTESIS